MIEDTPRIIRTPIPLAEVIAIAQKRFGDMTKAAVDLGRGVIAIGGELHSDEEALLLEDGAVQSDVWGINIYPAEVGDASIEFDSMSTCGQRPTTERAASTIRQRKCPFDRWSLP